MIRPSTTVNANTTLVSWACTQAAPGVPSIRAGRTAAGATVEELGDGPAAGDELLGAQPHRGGVGPQHDVGVKHQGDGAGRGCRSRDAARRRRRPQRVDPRRRWGRRAWSPWMRRPRLGAELAGCRVGGAAEDRADLVEWHREDVVQHEREAFGGSKRVEHDLQGRSPSASARSASYSGGRRRSSGVTITSSRCTAAGFPHVTAHPRACAQHVEADTTHDGGQPATEVVDAVGVGAAGVAAMSPGPRRRLRSVS